MIPVMNITRQYDSLKDALDKAALEILHSGQYILGDIVEKFEAEFAAYCGVRYAVGVGNGTDALKIALEACGIQPGDEVITCAMSFFATAEAIASIGAIPVFADCTADTYLLDVSKIEERITSKTKAIVPIHLYGQCVDMDALNEIARRYELKVIEDAAQGAGASYKEKKAGSMGDAGCISFFPTKNLGCAGDGGMIVTNSEDIYKQCLALRVHGSGRMGLFTYCLRNGLAQDLTDITINDDFPKYFNFILGYNSRLDALQASLLRIKLPYLDQWNQRRREIAKLYNKKIKNSDIILPVCREENEHIYYVYIVLVEKRDEFRRYLKENGIMSGLYFPLPLHLQKVFEPLGYKKGDMPNAEYLAEHGTAIPMFPELSQGECEYIIDIINRYKQ